jgi:hypothetical protein
MDMAPAALYVACMACVDLKYGRTCLGQLEARLLQISQRVCCLVQSTARATKMRCTRNTGHEVVAIVCQTQELDELRGFLFECPIVVAQEASFRQQYPDPAATPVTSTVRRGSAATPGEEK